MDMEDTKKRLETIEPYKGALKHAKDQYKKARDLYLEACRKNGINTIREHNLLWIPLPPLSDYENRDLMTELRLINYESRVDFGKQQARRNSDWRHFAYTLTKEDPEKLGIKLTFDEIAERGLVKKLRPAAYNKNAPFWKPGHPASMACNAVGWKIFQVSVEHEYVVFTRIQKQ